MLLCTEFFSKSYVPTKFAGVENIAGEPVTIMAKYRLIGRFTGNYSGIITTSSAKIRLGGKFRYSAVSIWDRTCGSWRCIVAVLGRRL